MNLRIFFGATVLVSSALAAPRGEAQVIQYDITDPRGNDLPAKLTFLTPDEKVPPKMDVKSRVPEFASRKNVVYQLYGKGEVPVPAGDYRVFVSHGMEWSIAVRDVHVTKDLPTALRATLDRVVDTRGYLSGDLHLHTKTFSGHGDANVEERLITLCAENLEWAVSTDHNHITDYRPYARRIGADRWLFTTVGNEVTTTAIGHMNTFPLDPRSRPINHRIIDARELFRKMRQNPLDEIIQLNHPRWTGIHGAYFRELDLSIGAGDPESRRFSYDFDSLEILNDNTLAGWEIIPLPEKNRDLEFDHSVRDDWFNLLNRGYTYCGVGNSDSHEVDVTIAGCPRNLVQSSTDDPARAVESELLNSIRRKQVTVTSGIFVTMAAGKNGLGSLTPAPGGVVELDLLVQAAPWVDADRLVVVGNGEPVFSAPLPPANPTAPHSPSARPVIRFRDTVKLHPRVDTWYIAYAVGDEPPYPMLHKVTVPLGFTNPIWVDADGDGRFRCLRDLAALAVAPAPGEARLRPGEITERLADMSPAFKRQAVALLAARRGGDRTGPLAELLRDQDPGVRQAVALALASMDDRKALLALLSGRDRASDGWERFVFDRELVKAGDFSALEDIRPAFAAAKDLDLFRMRRDLKELCRKNRIERWWVMGPFPINKVEDALATQYPPEREINYGRRYWAGEKTTARWRRVFSDTSHYLNLRSHYNQNENVVAYAQVNVHARIPVKTCLLLGSKCGLDIRVNGLSIHRQKSAESSSAASLMVPVKFKAGSNSLLIKAAVEKGEWGFNLMLVDPAGELQVTADGYSGRPTQSL